MLAFSHVISVLTLAVVQRRFIKPEKHSWDKYFEKLIVLFIFLKCVGTEAFFLCATVARLKSMFDYRPSGVVRVNFLPKPMLEP